MRQGKTKNTVQLLKELVSLRRRIAELGKTQRKLKKAENENHRSGMQLKDILDNMSVGVYQTTPDGRILMANPALVQMLGYSSFEEIKKLNVEEKGFAPGYHRSTFKELIEKEGKVSNFESAWLRRNGTTLYTSENARAVRDQSGKTLYYEGTVQDITNHRLLEESLKVAKERTDKVIEGTLGAIMVTDLMGKILQVNSEFEKGTGYKREKVIGKTPVELGILFEKDRQKIEEEVLPKLIGADFVRNVEIIAGRRDGTKFPILMNWTLARDSKGEPAFIVVTAWDLTELRKSEEGLKQYHLMVESAQDAIVFKNLKSRYVTVNKMFLDASGLSLEQVIGKNDYELMQNKDEATENIKGDNVVFRTGKPFETVRELTRADGSKRWFHILKVPHFYAEGKIDGLVAIGRDITEYKKSEDEVKAIKQQIEFILGATKTGLDIIDSQFNIRFINSEWQKVYGDPTGKKCYKYFMGRNKVCPDCGIVKALQTKTVTVSEEVLVRENNRPIQVITIPFQNEKGEWLVAEVNVDITERKKAEELLRATFNATTESVSLIDKDLNILLVNQTCAQRFGRTVEQIEGQNARNSVNYVGSAEVLNYRIEQINKVFHSGKPVRFEDERAGIFFDTNIYPVFDEKGEVSCAAIFGKDITEQKKSERSMRALFDATTESVFLLDKHLKVLALNKIAAQRFGKNPEQLVGTHIQDFLPNSASRDVVGRRIKQLNNVIRSGKPARIEDERMGMVFDTSIYPVFDAGGKVSSVAVFSKDITEEKKSKAALAESQLRYQTLFDNAPVGIGVADKESRPLAFNEAMLKMTGYSDAEMRQIRIKDTYVNPQQRQKLMKRLRRDGFVRDYEVQLKRKDGTVYDASLAIIPFILSGKKVFLTVQRDITKRKQAEEALRHSESKYKTLLENLPQRIFLKDKNSVYVSCNENYACDLKIKSEEIAGKTDYDFYPKKLAEKYRADDKKLIASGKTEDIEEKYIREGQETIVHTVKTPVKDKEGNITGILGIFWDITEQKKAEQELDAYREKMIQGEQMSSLGALGATLFHELTQPLTVANLSIENVLAKPQTKSIPEAIEKKLRDCLSGISDATSIVKRFRDYVRGLSKTTATDISLSAIAERVVNLLRGAAIRSKVRISVKHLEKLPSLNLRERDIELLFFVLIDNAIQAANGKKEHRLTISGAVKNEQVELQFSDNCSGIAPENLDKIFDPFFTTKPPSKGTGMGLCVVKHLVSQIRGNIRVESEVGKGSTFSVTLPVKMSGLL